jgi:hypothetical protein
MSSFWDSIGQKLLDGKLELPEVMDLIIFLKEMDLKNNNVTSEYLRKAYGYGYKFKDYDTLVHDIQNKGINKDQLGNIFSNLHSFDHETDQVIMNSYDKDKHYWVKHVTYRNFLGEFRDGVYKKKRGYNEF